MKTINNNFKKKRVPKLILLLVLSVLLTMQVKAQEDNVYQINLPGDLDGASGLAGDIITADGKVFVYTTKSVLVYGLNGDIITSIPFQDSKEYSKFAPHYFWPEKYLADGQMMTHNSTNHLLYVLTPELNIEIINTSATIPTAQDYVWGWEQNTPIQTPMHGFAVLKYDNIRKRLFLIYNSRKPDQSNPYSFHSRSVYFSISSISEDGLTRAIDLSEVFEMNSGFDYNRTIFDVEFNDIADENNILYNEFYLARRYIIETCELLTDENGPYIHVIREYPDNLVYVDNKPYPLCPNPGKFTKLLYIHEGNIHKIVAVPYKMPVDGHEPDDDCNVKFHVLDLDYPEGDEAKNQSIISPHKRIIDVAFTEGNNDLVMCFGDREEFFNPVYRTPEYYDYDMAYFHYDNSKGTFEDVVNWINSNPTSKGPDDFVKLNIPLRIVKNTVDPDNNSFFLCKANEIVRFDYQNDNYQVNSRYSGEGCHFYRGTSMGDQTFILNLGKNGFEIISNESFNDNNPTNIQTGFQALRICPDPINRKLYHYNDLNIHASEVFITSLEDHTADAEKLDHEGELDNTAIGSIVYNPTQNHVLISKNCSSGGILVLDAQHEDSEILDTQPTELQNTAYPKEMYISPNGKLYVLTNSRIVDPYIIDPVIKVFDANDEGYPLIRELTIDDFEQTDFTTYYADFCYNPYNDQVYAIISTNNTTYNPYFTTKNTEDVTQKGDDTNNGINRIYRQSVLINADLAENFILKDNIQMARQFICPDPDEIPEGYEGELIINAGFTEDESVSAREGLLLYDCASGNLISSFGIENNFNQICFSKGNQKLYGFEGPQELTDGLAHVANFYQLDYTTLSGFTNPDNFSYYNGQVLNIFTNPYDNKLYVQTKIDDKRLGAVQMQLLAYDMENLSEVPLETIDLTNRGHYVELDRNAEANYYYYPTTFPYIDPYKNKIYLPNGGHSNVSVVGFEANEPLVLENGPNWISIPRHKHEVGGVLLNSTLTSTVFDEEKFSDRYEILNLNYNLIKESEDNWGSEIVFAKRDASLNWTKSDDGNMDETVSTRGYILTLTPGSDGYLYMQGTVEDPSTKIDLYCGQENWVGYFIPQEQSVFDALADEFANLNVIKSLDYTCARRRPWATCHNTKSTNGYDHYWVCNGPFNVKYGDMLMLTAINDNLTSQGGGMEWNWQGNPPNSSTRPDVEYYEPEIKPTYTSMVIELDSTDNPQEIGAFVNDTCVGACSVLPSDTVVIMQAYLNGQPEDSVTFSEHYASREIGERKINKYSVLNLDNMLMERRFYQIGEDAPAVYVSFKQGNNNSSFVDKEESSFNIYPNPASDEVSFSLYSDKGVLLSVYVYSINGKMVANPIKQKIGPGFLESAIKLIDSSGNKLKPGLYLIRADIGNKTEVRKLSVK